MVGNLLGNFFGGFNMRVRFWSRKYRNRMPLNYFSGSKISKKRWLREKKLFEKLFFMY